MRERSGFVSENLDSILRSRGVGDGCSDGVFARNSLLSAGADSQLGDSCDEYGRYNP